MSAVAVKLPPPREPTMQDERWNRERIRGVEMMSPRPARRHTATASRIGFELARRFDGPKDRDGEPGGWVIYAEPELRLEGKDPVIPDIAGWREERAPDDDNDEAAYVTAPDWACEVLSPSTSKWDRHTKMPFYGFHRVGHLWIVDPAERQIEVYAQGRRGWELVLTTRGDEPVRLEPFEDVELQLSRIWPRKSTP